MQQSNYKNQKEGKALSFTAWGAKRPKFSAKKSLEADFLDVKNRMRLIFWSKNTFRSWVYWKWQKQRRVKKNQQLIFFSPVAILSQGHGSGLYCSIAP